MTTGEALAGRRDGWITAPFRFYEDHRFCMFHADEQEVWAVDDTGFSIPASGLPEPEPVPDTARADFETAVEAAVADLLAGHFSKTALSKVRNQKLDTGFDWADWFRAACVRFPNALVFFVHVPGAFTWAGATPELFLSADGNRVRSVSLAGTLHPDSPGSWTSKEAEEQALVTDYIRDIFYRSGFPKVTVSGPEVLRIGSLQHLKTAFDSPYSVEAGGLGRLVENLHPTPAVGGMPKREGVDFLLAHERHARRMYSGFLGSLSAEGELDLYVNLRSMSVDRHGALLYAGAGITGRSLPEAEWLETENKLAMNLDLLRG